MIMVSNIRLSNLKMGLFMMAISKESFVKAKELRYGRMELSMKGNGRRIVLGVTVNLHIKMVIAMKVNGLTVKQTVQAPI
jgi:hypothetical protein